MFNGFLVLDVIFLGNIVIENVEFDLLMYDLVVWYGFSLCWMFNVDVFYFGCKMVYQKGGVGGLVVVIVEEQIIGSGIGDVSLSVNYKLFVEIGVIFDIVFIFGVIVFIGQVFYGIDWKVIEWDND